MSSSGPGFPHDSTLPLLVAFLLALAFLGVVVAIGLSDGADGAPAAKTATDSLADTQIEETPRVTLALDTAGEGRGTVRVAGEPRVCSGECRFTFDRDTSVTIIARAAPGSKFVSWTGSCGGGRICTVLLDRSINATALFSVKAAEPPEVPTSEGPDCEDKVDNDGDGTVDIEDEECLLGSTESGVDPADIPRNETVAPPPGTPVQPPPVVVPPPVVPPPPVVVPPPPPGDLPP